MRPTGPRLLVGHDDILGLGERVQGKKWNYEAIQLDSVHRI